MPCDQSWWITQELLAENRDLLIKALTAMGCRNIRLRDSGIIHFTTPSANLGRIANGQITLDARDQALINPIKQAYSREILRSQAERFAWTMTIQDNEVLITKRSF